LGIWRVANSAVDFPGSSTQVAHLVAGFKASGVSKKIQGAGLQLSTTDGGKIWTCKALVQANSAIFTTVDSKYLPGACK
jgi:hypothetical protein